MSSVLHSVLAIAVLTVFGTSTAVAQRPATKSLRDTTPSGVVRAYVAAFNVKDLDAMIGQGAPDLEWMSVAGDSVVVGGRGASAFRQLLAGYFREVPSARSELMAVHVTGAWVTTHEQTRWTVSASGVSGQSSVVVYEVRDGLVRRVWFYPPITRRGPANDGW